MSKTNQKGLACLVKKRGYKLEGEFFKIEKVDKSKAIESRVSWNENFD